MEEKHLSVTNAGKIIDILKNRNEAKSVLNSYNIEDAEVLAIVTRIIDDIIKIYDGDNKDLAIQGSKYLLEFGMESLPQSKSVSKQPATIEKIQKEIRTLISNRGVRSASFSITVDNKGLVQFL